ncbi:MAG: hypothetical protein IIA41_11610 [SAR324 cluster bacterium]|nr:hypothetical protein [SAR324 cluster bacterium]
MRNPVARMSPRAVQPVGSKPGPTARQRTATSRTFAELLAEAEAVTDEIVLQRRRADLRARGRLRGADWRAGSSVLP